MTPEPDLPSPPGKPPVSRRMSWTALLRPWGLLVLAIGGFFFAATLAWWILPLTLATYVSLVFLATRVSSPPPRTSNRSLQPPLTHDQRIRRLSQRDTRRKVQTALEAYGRVLVAIEGSDMTTKTSLSAVTRKLRQAFDTLLDIAELAEKLPRDASPRTGRSDGHGEEANCARPDELEERLRAADLELSEAPGRLHTFRAEVVRASIEGGEAGNSRAAALRESLDGWQRNLQALSEGLSPTDAH